MEQKESQPRKNREPHQSSIGSHQKTGTLTKLAGYLFKTPEKRHFVLYRNKYFSLSQIISALPNLMPILT